MCYLFLKDVIPGMTLGQSENTWNSIFQGTERLVLKFRSMTAPKLLLPFVLTLPIFVSKKAQEQMNPQGCFLYLVDNLKIQRMFLGP